jgi:dihydrofolate reductase
VTEASAGRPLVLVVAVADGGVIGKDGGLPWKLPEDLRHFKAATMGHVMIMGRKTWDSIGRPLPGRTTFVVSRTPGFHAEGARVFGTFDAALESAYAEDPEPRVVGGAAIYEEALPRATKILLTEVHRAVEGDTFFPAFDRGAFRETERRAGETTDVEFVTLERTR